MSRPTHHGCCPECRRRVPVFMWHGRLNFEHHARDRLARPPRGVPFVPCLASGWLVEDEELVA